MQDKIPNALANGYKSNYNQAMTYNLCPRSVVAVIPSDKSRHIFSKTLAGR